MDNTTPDLVIEAAPKQLAIVVNSPAGYIISGLALYGAKALVLDAKQAVTKFRENRKAKKATEKVEEPTSTPEQ